MTIRYVRVQADVSDQNPCGPHWEDTRKFWTPSQNPGRHRDVTVVP